MTRRGFTLVELLIVIALIGIMLSMATFNFSQYTRKSGIVNQTKTLYGDLMEYRLKALYEKKDWTIKISSNSYAIYSSSVTTVAPVSSVVLKYPVTSNNATDIIYGSYGLANVSGKTVCVTDPNDAAVDSLVISQTRVQIGKKQQDMDCEAGKIDAK